MLRSFHLVAFCTSVVTAGLLTANASHAGDTAESAKPAGVVPWEKPDRQPSTKLTSQQLDELVIEGLRGKPMVPPISDEQFLRRASLDLIGRPPTPAEMDGFLTGEPAGRRAAAIDRLLADEEFGINWANYWSDVISYRTPPPKSTRDEVNDVFGFDPSVDRQTVSRTMKQAMWLINDRQLQQQINVAPDSDTVLGRLLAEETDNGKAVERLFQAVLARRATPREIELTLGHVKAVGDRGQAFEDVLWSLINSAEFTSRR